MQVNDNLLGTEEMDIEELEEHRDQLQAEAQNIKHMLSLRIAEQGDRVDKVWVAKAEKAKDFKTQAINRINARLGKLRRAEKQRQQRYLETVFMRVAQRDLGDERFFALLRKAQTEAQF